MEYFIGIDLAGLIETVGYIGIFAIVFAESGLLIGFFLPGDSLLFTAGILASQGYFNIAILTFLCFAGAVLGDSFGYAFGRKAGPKIFTKEDSILFHKSHLERARRYYEKHGGKTIILARFVPIVRTFAPILAGVGGMHYKTFLSYNVFGGLIWGAGLTLLGYFLGSVIPDVDRFFFPLIASIIVLSFLPPVIHVLRDKEERRQILKFLKMRK